MNRFLWMVILSHRSCLKKNPENIVAPFRYNTLTQNQNVDTIFYSKYFFIFCIDLKKIVFHSYKSDKISKNISDKN